MDCVEVRVGTGLVLMASVEAENEAAPAKKPLKPRQCHKYLQEELAREFRHIVAGFVGEARKGGCAHMKLAAELLEEAKPEPRPKKGPAQRWLEELGD